MNIHRLKSLQRQAICAVLLMLIGCVATTHSQNILRLQLTGDPPTLNSLLFDDPNTYTIAMMINGYLLRTDAHGRLIPDLATVVPTVSNGGISTDSRIITYHLRHGIRWQDGQPFDARDVAFS